MRKEMEEFEVTEDECGGLTLFVFDNDGNIKYAHTGYEYNVGQLLTDLKTLKSADYPVAEWDGNFENENEPRWTNQELYDDLLYNDCRIICDNYGIYYSRMGLSGWTEFKESVEAIAAMIRTSETWIYELNYELCKYAGIEDEFEKADAESSESVVYKAADMLGVAI